jgi:hypothetical protein
MPWSTGTAARLFGFPAHRPDCRGSLGPHPVVHVLKCHDQVGENALGFRPDFYLWCPPHLSALAVWDKDKTCNEFSQLSS